MTVELGFLAGKPARQKNQRRSRPFRREIILRAATELFGVYGYSGVRISEIAANAGITGPAIYRHFHSKQGLLAAVLEASITRHWAELRRALDQAKTPHDGLVSLVILTVSAAIENRCLVSAYHQVRHLPDPERKRLRSQQRLLVGEWAGVLSRIRPDLTAAEVRLTVLAVFNMIEGIGQGSERIDRSRLEQLVGSMALSALLGNGLDVPAKLPDARKTRNVLTEE